MRPKHFAERHGLIIIIALGESIVALGLAASEEPQTAAVVTASVFGMVVVAALWWLYFDVVALAAEKRLGMATGAERNAIARDSYSYLHALMILGHRLPGPGAEEVAAGRGRAAQADPVGRPLRRAWRSTSSDTSSSGCATCGSLNVQRTVVAVLLVVAIPHRCRRARVRVADDAASSLLVALIVYEVVTPTARCGTTCGTTPTELDRPRVERQAVTTILPKSSPDARRASAWSASASG